MTVKRSLFKACAYGTSLFFFVVLQGCGVGFKAEVKDGVGALSAKEIAAEKEKSEKEKAEAEAKAKADKEKADKEAKAKEEAAKAAAATEAATVAGDQGTTAGDQASGSSSTSSTTAQAGTPAVIGTSSTTTNTNETTGSAGAQSSNATAAGSMTPAATNAQTSGTPAASSNTPAATTPATDSNSGESTEPPKPAEIAAASVAAAAQPVVQTAAGTAPLKLPTSSLAFDVKAISSCPSSYLDSVENLSAKGYKGVLNSGVSNTVVSYFQNSDTPSSRNSCQKLQPKIGILSLDSAQAIEGLAKLFNMDPKVLQQVDAVCEKDLVSKHDNPEDAKWLRAYALVAFAKKWTAFEDSIIRSLMLRQQLAMMNPNPKGSPVECKSFQTSRLKVYCAAVSECQTPAQRSEAFTAKSKALLQAIVTVQEMKVKAQQDDKLKQSVAALEKFSVLKSPRFQKYINELGNNKPTEKEVRDLFYNDILDQMAKVDLHVSETNLGLNCIIGASPNDCSKAKTFELENLSDSPSRFIGADSKAGESLAILDQFHSCMGQIREVSMAETVGTVAGTGVAMALAYKFSPTLLRSAKFLAKRAPKVVAKSGRLSLAAASIGMATSETLNINQQCNSLSGSITEHESAIRNRLLTNQAPMTCESHGEEMLIAEAVDSCTVEYAKVWAMAAGGTFIPEFGALSKLSVAKLFLKSKGAVAAATTAGETAATAGAAGATASTTGTAAVTATTTATSTAAKGTYAVKTVVPTGAKPINLQDAAAMAKQHNALATTPATAAKPVAQPVVTPQAAAPAAAPKSAAVVIRERVQLKDAIGSVEGARLQASAKILNRTDVIEALNLSRNATNAEIRTAFAEAKAQFNGTGQSLSYKDAMALKRINSKLTEIEQHLP